MALPRVDIFIDIHGDPSVGIPSLTDHLELQWDLDEMEGERDRVREILRSAWAELYNNNVDVRFMDECCDCGNIIPNHKPSCPHNITDW